MPAAKVTFDMICKIGLALPDVEIDPAAALAGPAWSQRTKFGCKG